MIKGMTRAGQIFEREEWISSAVRALDFIRSRLWQNDRLLATFKDDKAHLNAYLDDHAFLLDSLLTLLQADFRQTDLDFAITLADVLLTRFEDKTSGGFFLPAMTTKHSSIDPKRAMMAQFQPETALPPLLCNDWAIC